MLRNLRCEMNLSAKDFRTLGFRPYLSLFTLSELKEAGFDAEELFSALVSAGIENFKIVQLLVECDFSYSIISQLNTSFDCVDKSSQDRRILLQLYKDYFVIPLQDLKYQKLKLNSHYYNNIYLENELRERGGYTISDFAELSPPWSVYRAGFKINDLLANGFTDE
jgi:hypothetical protein